MTASGAWFRTAAWTHFAPSADTCVTSFAPSGPEGVEKGVDGGGVTTRGSPKESAGVVTGHRRQVAVPSAMGDLVDADTGDTVEAVGAAQGVGHHPFDHRGHRPPRHPQQLGGRGPRAMRRHPRAAVLERPAEPGRRPGPRHGGHHHAMAGTAHPGRAASRCTIIDPRSSDRHRRRPEP